MPFLFQRFVTVRFSHVFFTLRVQVWRFVKYYCIFFILSPFLPPCVERLDNPLTNLKRSLECDGAYFQKSNYYKTESQKTRDSEECEQVGEEIDVGHVLDVIDSDGRLTILDKVRGKPSLERCALQKSISLQKRRNV